jgi:hypothetical protein
MVVPVTVAVPRMTSTRTGMSDTTPLNETAKYFSAPRREADATNSRTVFAVADDSAIPDTPTEY